MLVLARSVNDFETLCTSVDISIGNVYDKVFRLLALPSHPDELGPGAALERFCDENQSTDDHDIPRFALAMPKQLRFSYAGLLSAVQNEIKKRLGDNGSAPGELSHEDKVAIAHGFQKAAVAQLEEKLGLVLDLCLNRGLSINHLVLSGGVASNEFVRNRQVYFVVHILHKSMTIRLFASLRMLLKSSSREETRNISLCCPPAELCTGESA